METTKKVRKGFALLITLAVLAASVALLGILSGYLDRARLDSDKNAALVQARLLFEDMRRTLKKQKRDETFYAALYASPIPFVSEDGKFSLNLSCTPIDKGVNIHWLFLPEEGRYAYLRNAVLETMDKLSQTYGIVDSEKLVRMIESFAQTTEREKERRHYLKDGIITYEQFRDIVETYIRKNDDREIERVKWKNYFVFYPPEENLSKSRIHGDFATADLIALWFDTDKEAVAEDWTPAKGSFEAFLSARGLAYDKRIFSEAFPRRSVCEVDFVYKEATYGFRFSEIEGEVRDFEFLGETH